MLFSLGNSPVKAVASIVKFSSRSLSTGKLLHASPLLRKVVYRIPVFRYSSTVAKSKMTNENYVVKRYDNITKGANDQREYRGLELANGLRILLISDPTADKSAAALDVAVGHLMDSWDLPGTAHFCEHMLFLGTEKYPSENEYGKFISSHAGSTNAYTASDHTNYHFDVKPEELHGALDRFVQFFLAPQFTEAATDREVCAVDSEHKNNVNNDNWRNLQIDRNMSKVGHDYGKFGTGNKQTLMEDAKLKGIECREALLEFHKKWYSSNIMSCVIVGKESLDQLQSYLFDLQFAEIENKNVEKKVWEEHPYGPEQLKKKVIVVPIKDTRMLKVVFPVADMSDHYKSQPGHYLSHLLGHEGPGSLLSELKRLGWVSSLFAGESHMCRGLATFDVQVDLSAEGVKHVDEILELLFNYIGMLKKSVPQEWIQDELRHIASTKFRFKDKETPMSFVTTLASDLQKKPFDDILSYRYDLSEYKPELISEILSEINPDNMYYRVVARQFAGEQGNQKEAIYGTEFRIDDISEDTIARFREALNVEHSSFHLPERNQYIPSKFDLKPRDAVKSEHPRIVHDDSYTRVWFKQDDEYKLPKMNTIVAITAPMVARCPKTSMLSSMYLWCLNDALAEETYNAELAGLKCELDVSPYGCNIKVAGYDEKQPLFVEYIFKRIVEFNPDPIRFNVLFDAVKRALENFAHSQPYSLSQHFMLLLLSEKFWSKEQLLSVCEDITVEDVAAFGKEMLGYFHVEMFSHGNVVEQEAVTLGKSVTQILRTACKNRPLFQNEYVPMREHALEDGSAMVYRHFQSTHDVSAVEVLYQAGVQNTKDNSIVEMLVQLLREPAFNQLRTKEQLGYIVWTGVRLNCGTLGIQVIVQGPKDPDHVLERIEAFLEQSRKEIEELSEESFNQEREGVITKLLVKPKTMTGRFRRFWTEIEARQYDFDRNQSEVDMLKTITKKDVLAYFDKKIGKNSESRRKIAVFVHGKDQTQDALERTKREVAAGDQQQLEEVGCVEQLRLSLSLYGRPKPKMVVPPFGVDVLTPPVSEKANL